MPPASLDMLFLQEGGSWSWLVCLSCCLLPVVWSPVEGGAGDPGSRPSPEPAHEDPDQEEWELGSGASLLQELLHSFPADSPFVTETLGKPANCTQRFWLPPSSPVCWDDVAGPEEFDRSRLLVLQNRAALRAVSQSSGVVVEEGAAASYNQQAHEDLQGIRADHLSMTEGTETIQKVFLTLEETRREGKEHQAFTSLKEHIANTKDSISGKDLKAALLERQFTSLEKSLHVMQHRLNKLMIQ